MCGFLTLEHNLPGPEELLARLAFAKGLRGDRIPPMRPLPLVLSPDQCVVARWGWPNQFGAGLPTHCRSETAARLPTWSEAWHTARGVVPVMGWHEGDRAVDEPDVHLAVLWKQVGEEFRLVMLTQQKPPGSQVERYPVPLTPMALG